MSRLRGATARPTARTPGNAARRESVAGCNHTAGTASPAPAVAAPDALERAIATHAHAVPVAGSGVVTRVLREDVRGARHQRFLVRTDAGHTILIAYNIDLAPRIIGLRAGGALSFAGEYVWNRSGGLVHWTHRDPSHRHSEGYIRYHGRLYR